MKHEKIIGLEFLRLIATIGVIGDHVPLCTVKYFDNVATDMDKFIYFGTMMFCHWPVPIFMMITGYLMLNKKELNYSNIWKYFNRILILLVGFGFIFALMELYFNEHTLSLSILSKAIYNVFVGQTWKHLWYLYMLLGIYLLLPVLHSYTKNIIPPRMLLATVLIFSSLLPFFNIKCGIDFPMSSVFVGYALLGFLLSRTNIDGCRWLNLRFVFPITAVTFFILLAEAYDLYINHFEWAFKTYPYTSPLIIIQSTGIFIIAMKLQRRLKNCINSRLVVRFNRCSLGIYIIHMFWVNLALKVFHINIINYNYIMILVGVVGIFLLSWMTTEVMIKIPVLKKYL